MKQSNSQINFTRNSSAIRNRRLQVMLGLPASIGLFAGSIDTLGITNAELMQIPPSLARSSKRRQREYLAGRYCAARALRQSGCHPDFLVDIGSDGAPIWPRGWVGSISHSSTEAIAVTDRLSSCMAVGIDVEEWIKEQNIVDVQHQIADSAEFAALSQYARPEAITLIFSAKETLYKALYPQVRQFFDYTAARVISCRPQVVDILLCTDLGSAWRQGSVFSVSYICDLEHVYTALYVPIQHSRIGYCEAGVSGTRGGPTRQGGAPQG